MDIIEVFERFPTQEACLAYLEKLRWRGKPVCPYCESSKTTAMPKEQRHHCNNCNTTFSVTVGTIFHRTHLPMQKWLLAVSLVLSAKKGISARQLARHLKVNRNTAWRMGMKIREAMTQRAQRELLAGVVEMDETRSACGTCQNTWTSSATGSITGSTRTLSALPFNALWESANE